ncbi:MAG: hypothetical protein H7Z12_15175 [Rhodospirillaceae bacterium]|nr:hypothetical protein [Rhodospirillales bacterium]
MAADDVRRTRDKHKDAGLKKTELWVPPEMVAHLKAIEAVLRGKKGDDTLAARVASRLALTADLIGAAQAPAPAFSRDDARAASASLVKAG